MRTRQAVGDWRKRFGVALVAAVAWTSVAAAQIPDVPGWQLRWHDEFDGNSLDTSKWVALNRKDSYNNEKQYYHPNQVVVADGMLQITAINTPRSGKAYQSGLITSKDLHGVGRYEARMDLPTTQGMWPAFWLNPNQVQWPLGGEIDILENRGSQPNLTSSAFHWQRDAGPCCGQHQYAYHDYTATENGSPVNFHTGFHTYAVEWETNVIRFYVDDNLHFTINKTGGMSDANFTTAKNIIVNLAVGGDFGGDPNGTTVWPQTLQVDYVRVWSKQTGLSGDYDGDGVVTASDYTVWRDSQGSSGLGLPADGSGNGTVDEADFTIWKNSFGATAGAAGLTAVPEPPALWLMLAGAAGFRLWGRLPR